MTTGSKGTGAASQEPMPRRLSLLRQSYLEVLDATKHQDDKIGRFLTAIAFLTTGAIALLFSSDLLEVGFVFPGDDSPHKLLGWATGGFFFCVLTSVGLLLLCLSSPLRLPGKPSDWGPKLADSRLFYAYIAEEPVESWRDRWLDPSVEDIERELEKQYALEIHNLSERARLKYQHTHEASSLFVLSLLFLGCAVVLAIAASVSDSEQAVDVTRWTSAGIGIVAATHAFAQIYVRVIHDRKSFQLVVDAARGGPDSKAEVALVKVRSIRWLLITVPGFVLTLAILSRSAEERRAAAFLIALLLLSTFLLTKSRWTFSKRSSAAKHFVLNGFCPLAVAAIALCAGGVSQMLAALLAPTWLSALATVDNERRVRKAQNELAESVRKTT